MPLVVYPLSRASKQSLKGPAAEKVYWLMELNTYNFDLAGLSSLACSFTSTLSSLLTATLHRIYEHIDNGLQEK